MTVTSASPAVAASSAVLGDVQCAQEQGSVELALTADPDAPGDVDFVYFLDSVSDGDPISVAPGNTVVVTIDDLDDAEHTLEVNALELTTDNEFTLIFEETFEVTCDAAPVGDYTNPAAQIFEGCGHEGNVFATNRPIGGNVEDLQPTTFLVTASKDGKTDAIGEFTLPDSIDDPYTHTLLFDLTSYFPNDSSLEGLSDNPEAELTSVTVAVTANGVVIASTEHFGHCVVIPQPESSGGGAPAVVNTGA